MRRHFKILLIIGLVIGHIPLLAQFTLQDSLLAHYKLDNNGLDATGNGNNGTIIGAQPVADRFGNPNSAYSFDGIGDKVVISDAFFNQRPGTDEFTMSAWCKFTGQKTGIILSQTTSCSSVSQDYFILALTYVNGRSDVYAQLYSHNPFVEFDDQLVLDNEWHFIVYTYKSGNVKLYLNGTVVSSGSYNHAPQNFNYNGNVNWVIGGAHINSCSHNNDFEGLIDDVKIYSRALDDNEVLELLKIGNVNFSAQSTNCDLEVNFVSNVTNADSYSWDFGDGNNSTAATPIHTYGSAGTYVVTLTTIINGITTVYMEDIIVNTPPVADFDVISTVQTNTSVIFTDQSSDDVLNWDWVFGDGTNSTMQNPEKIYTTPGIYTVSLTVFDDFNCQDRMTKEITVSDNEQDFFINFPNAFTPNGDGSNDRFEILSASNFYEIENFRIYNRWGNIVYDAPDETGWNGIYNGEMAPMDTYIYVLNIRLQDNTVRQFKGEVLLIR